MKRLAALCVLAACASAPPAEMAAPGARRLDVTPVPAIAGDYVQDWVRLRLREAGAYDLGLDTMAVAPAFASGTYESAGDVITFTDAKGPCAQKEETRIGRFTVTVDKAGVLFKVKDDACDFRAGIAGEVWRRDRGGASLDGLLPAAATTPEAAAAGKPKPLKVLFIGNSYTYVNDLPGMLMQLGAAGAHPIAAEALLVPGATLEMHWGEGRGVAALHLDEDRHDVVVLQEQSMRPLEDPGAFAKYAKLLAARARVHGSRLVLMATWPRQKTPERAAQLASAYADLGRELGAEVAKVGTAWMAARAKWPAFTLYADDGSHPAAGGSYLAALVVYRTITGASPAGLPPVDHHGAKLSDVSDDLAAELQKIAAAP